MVDVKRKPCGLSRTPYCLASLSASSNHIYVYCDLLIVRNAIFENYCAVFPLFRYYFVAVALVNYPVRCISAFFFVTLHP